MPATQVFGIKSFENQFVLHKKMPFSKFYTDFNFLTT